jgi:hypothetical protein
MEVYLLVLCYHWRHLFHCVSPTLQRHLQEGKELDVSGYREAAATETDIREL